MDARLSIICQILRDTTFSEKRWTWSSRSALECSWNIPRAWRISCMGLPGPPRHLGPWSKSYVVLAKVSSFAQSADASSLQMAAMRDKRGARWTPRPTPAEVRLFTLRTEFLSKIYRGLIRFERRWYDLMSSSSVFQVSSFLTAGVVATFLLLFVPLFFALCLYWASYVLNACHYFHLCS